MLCHAVAVVLPPGPKAIDPNHLKFTELGQPTKIITRASKTVSNLSLQSSLRENMMSN